MSSAVAVACGLVVPNVARAEPGNLVAVEVGTNGSNYGYWEYLPEQYADDGSFPLLVFLSGIGEVGTGLDDGPCSFPTYAPDFTGNAGLCNNLRHGPQMLIWQGIVQGNASLWPDESRPFVMIAPQNPIPNDAYSIDDLDVFFDYLASHYALDERRLYLTGMSQGGRSVFLHVHDYPDRFAAVSTMPGIAGTGSLTDACTLGGQNWWMFHGENDAGAFLPQSIINFYNAFNACPAPHPTARLTIYLNAGHNVWSRTVDPSQGMDDPTNPAYQPYDLDVYSWLQLHDKPVVDAGPDLDIPNTEVSFDLEAVVVDEDTVSYAWTQISGPASLTIQNANSAAPTVTDLAGGDYAFRVQVVDADGMDVEDVVAVAIEPPLAGTGTETTGSSGSESSSPGSSEVTGGDGPVSETGGPQSTGDADASSSDSAGETFAGSAGETVGPGGEESGSAAATGPGTDTGEAMGDGVGGCSCAATERGGAAWMLVLVGVGRVRRRGQKRRA